MSETSEPPASPGLLSDDSRDGTAERPDELDRLGYVVHATMLLENVRAQSESTVLALIGDWGSGKSSILEMLHQRLQEPWRVAVFNPWTYPDTPTLQRGFFSELTAALPDGSQPGRAREKIGAFAQTISPLGKLGGLVGIDAQELIRAAGDLIAGDSSASAAKKSAETALRAAAVPVLMIVDDLDRLTPDELLEVLKLVRLVGRLPHVYYLLSYDERTLLDVLRRTSVTGNDEGRARAYIEKIVQVRLDMPTLRIAQRGRLLNDGLDKVGAAVGLRLTDADERRLGGIYFDALDNRLTTPRAIMRFLGQIQAFYPLLRGEVDFVDFFLVNWLRTQEPGVYRMLQTYRDDFLGRDFSRLTVERDAAAQASRRRRWDERLDAAQVQSVDRPGVIKVLSSLFPELASAYADAQYLVSAQQRTTPKAISHIDYFDRYLTFGIPQEDVSDADIMLAIADLESGKESPAVARLGEEIARQPARAMRKLEALREAQVPLPESAIFGLIANVSPKIDRRRGDIFENPWRSVVRGGAASLAAMGSDRAGDAVSRFAGVADLVEYVASVVSFLKPRDAESASDLVPAGYDWASVASVASAAIDASLATHCPSSPLHDGAMSIFWTWRQLDPDAAKEWLLAQVDTDRWSMADTVGAFTTTAVALGVPNPIPRIADFESQDLDEILGLDRVLAALDPYLDTAVRPSGDHFEIPATPQNRVAYALFHLRQLRDARTTTRDDEKLRPTSPFAT